MTRAFTLSEFLIVIAIIAILSVIVFPYYHSARQQLALQRAANKLAQDIRRVQEMAMSVEEYLDCEASFEFEYSYGIYLDDNEPQKYKLFADCNNNKEYGPDTDEIVEEIEMEKESEIENLSSSPLRIIFSPPDPVITIKPSSVDLAVIDIANQKGQTRTVKVNKAGLIYVE